MLRAWAWFTYLSGCLQQWKPILHNLAKRGFNLRFMELTWGREASLGDSRSLGATAEKEVGRGHAAAWSGCSTRGDP